MLIIRVVSVIIILLLMKCVYRFIRSIRMLSHDEYKLLKKLSTYKKDILPNKEWTLLSEEFLEHSKIKELNAIGILPDLHKRGLVVDTAILNGGTAHSVKITESGKHEMERYKRQLTKKVILYIFSTIFIPVVVTLITIRLQNLIF